MQRRQYSTGKQPLFTFQIYAPHSSYPDEDKEQFFDILQQEISELPKKNNYLLMGDFNRKVGKEAWKTRPNNVGKFGTNTVNEKGVSLLQFCAVSGLGILNTMYKHPSQYMNFARWENSRPDRFYDNT